MIAPADVLAVERVYAEAASRSLADFDPGAFATAEQLRHARACIGAVASRYLAVGTPRSFGVVIAADGIDDVVASLAAHRTWFAPRDVRIAIAPTKDDATKDIATKDIATKDTVRKGIDVIPPAAMPPAAMPPAAMPPAAMPPAAMSPAAMESIAAIGARVVTIDEALACDIACVYVPMPLVASQLRRGTHVNALARVELDADLRTTTKLVDERTLALMVAGRLDGRQLDEITIFLAGELGNALTCSPSPSSPSP